MCQADRALFPTASPGVGVGLRPLHRIPPAAFGVELGEPAAHLHDGPVALHQQRLAHEALVLPHHDVVHVLRQPVAHHVVHQQARHGPVRIVRELHLLHAWLQRQVGVEQRDVAYGGEELKGRDATWSNECDAGLRGGLGNFFPAEHQGCFVGEVSEVAPLIRLGPACLVSDLQERYGDHCEWNRHLAVQRCEVLEVCRVLSEFLNVHFHFSGVGATVNHIIGQHLVHCV
mmetsp:Transcript_19192/g.48760  ORF Transcript_19192/g.48760 Transcript_19192/m.48760 type:complete len:230 (-) Transcript_19192:647-1336(-)